MKLLILGIFAILALSCEGLKSYNGYVTFRVFPKDEAQVTYLGQLYGRDGYDFWTRSKIPGHPVDIMVNPEKVEFFKNLMKLNNFDSEVLIANVGLIPSAPVEKIRADGSISFKAWNRYETMVNYLKKLEKTYPHVSLFSMGQSYEGREQYGVKISSGQAEGKPAIFVDGGIHAREWLGPAQVLYIINQLAENTQMAYMWQDVDWWIVPSLNPDGYEYSQTKDKMWRKTRSKGRICYGADPNRNYGFHWGEVGTSNYECDEIYAGPRAFSEDETINMKNFVANIPNIEMYLTFHSYGNYMLYPWGYTSALPSNWKVMDALAHKADDAIANAGGKRFTIGSSTNVLYAAAGGSDDWMMAIAGVPITYTIELPDGGAGFHPPTSKILPYVTQVFEGVKVFGKYVADLAK